MIENMKNSLKIGIDIGSISLNTVILNSENEIIENRYDYCHGRPYVKLFELLKDLISKYGESAFEKVAFTGSGGQKAADLLGGYFVNEIIAQSSSVSRLYPKVKTIIEMGGEDSKLIFMNTKKSVSYSQLDDFAMNSLCAAGTGSFLDQQANRIGVTIEKEFGELALLSKNPPRIAGRCSVFAKSDMIHLQQVATPLHDIVAGLCFAVARNFKSNLGRGKEFQKPILFQGGVAANAGVVRAFKEVLKLEEGELIIPQYHASMGAIGTLYHVIENMKGVEKKFKGIKPLENYLNELKSESISLAPLIESKAEYKKEIIRNFPETGEKLPVYLGLDIGSLSTNVVLIDKDNNVVARRYLPTASKPLNAIQKGLKEIFEEVGNKVVVKAAGTTGSGRYLTGDFIGADSIQNEITAQATAAIAFDPTVDTIFEIGGQDSKYIRIEEGVVTDFEMNKVCAAGTGSFIEEQSEKLGINIKEEFGKLALQSKTPVKMGERCTVFMESDLNAHQQQGEDTKNLVGGLAYSIVQNYINRVVGDRKIGDKVFFQGGVTHNKAVVAAFENIIGKPIIIPPHFDVTGAIGAAMLARDSMKPGQKTRFKGFEVSSLPFSQDKFTCKACSNVCEIHRIRIEGHEKALFYGGRCDKYEVDDRKNKGEGIPNLFKERFEMLTQGYKFEQKIKKEKTTIGIPRALMVFYQQFPFWRSFFEELDFQVVVSKETDMALVKNSTELSASETCFPVEIMHGHVNDLLEKEVDYVFLPFIVNMKAEKDNPTSNCNCPWVQSYPFMMRAAFQTEEVRNKFLIPTLHFRFFGKVLNKEVGDYFNEKFGIAKSKIKKAIKIADKAQSVFENKIKQRGLEVLNNLPENKEAAVMLGRPYNTGDPALNLRLVEKLINLDVLPIPVDFLPLDGEHIFDEYPMMYWPNGQKILSAARIAQRSDKLFAVYLGNFRCGPDSFLTHFVQTEMKGKPFLHLQVDQHSADAGLITRCEAFLDSFKGYKQTKKTTEQKKIKRNKSEDRVVYFPYMRDSAYAAAAASRYCGLKAEVLPMQTERDLELARKHTNGDECFPFIATTGSFLKKMEEPGIDPKKVSFFMPDHNGPCRFGEYNKLQRQIFDKLGYHDVEILAPSNDDAYANISRGNPTKFRMTAWKGFVAVDMLRKMQQERRPYESVKGMTNQVYKKHLTAVEKSCENGAKDIVEVMERAAEEFASIPIYNGYRKPLIAIVGEIFMRDNAFCSGNIVERLEALGAETVMAPLSEWLSYSTYRYTRDSLWKGDIAGVFKSKLQKYSQNASAHKIHKAVKGVAELDRDVEINDMMGRCGTYVHKDYDGDPPLSLGAASKMAEEGISGVVAILPFTCMPGTLIASVSQLFRKDHNNIPWENIAYDGQEDTGLETRLQAFMHQAHEYLKLNKLGAGVKWKNQNVIKKETIEK